MRAYTQLWSLLGLACLATIGLGCPAQVDAPSNPGSDAATTATDGSTAMPTETDSADRDEGNDGSLNGSVDELSSAGSQETVDPTLVGPELAAPVVSGGEAEMNNAVSVSESGAAEITTTDSATTEATETAEEVETTTEDTETAGQSAATEDFQLEVPLGLPEVPIPEDNPMTSEKVELGKLLYFDPRMSKDGTVSCATCHEPTMAWAEDTPTSTGIKDQLGRRNSPTVINSAYAPELFWDGRAASLEEQALGPVQDPLEMGNTLENLVETMRGIPEYVERFEKVFGTEPTAEGFAKAVAAFERTVLSGDSPYDRYMAGDETAMTEAQVRGMELFQNVGCADCHMPPVFSDFSYYNAGVGMDKDEPDEGRKEVTGFDFDMGAFRVPALRNVAETAPYFHDGSVSTLEEAVALMAAGGKDNPHRSSMFDYVRDAEITPEQQEDLVAFLKALSGEYPIVEPPQLP